VNCEEFRRKLHEDPRCRDPDFLAHREVCAPCRDEARQVEVVEARLGELLQEPPPADLKARLRQVPRKGGFGFLPLAMAASLSGLVALGALWLGGAAESSGVVAEVLEHIEHEPRALEAILPLPEGAWRTLSSRVHLDTDGWDYAVTYAAPCELMHQPGLHLVLAVDSASVTVLVIVDREIDQARMFSDDGHRGVVRPLSRGTLAVVGPDARAVDELAAELAERIEIRGLREA
jgi:hypothetical protein